MFDIELAQLSFYPALLFGLFYTFGLYAQKINGGLAKKAFLVIGILFICSLTYLTIFGIESIHLQRIKPGD